MTAPDDQIDFLRAARSQPEQMEAIFRQARQQRRVGRFAAAIDTLYREAPDDLLYAAWHYRLAAPSSEAALFGSRDWRLIISLSLALGLALWALSDPSLQLAHGVPLLVYLWVPVVALFLCAYFFLTTRQAFTRLALAFLAVAGLTAYSIAIAQLAHVQSAYLPLAVLHLPVIGAGAIAVYLIGWRLRANDLFAYLIKAIEALGTAGVYAIIGSLFAGLTYLLFHAINVELPPPLIRLLIIGVGGWIPLIAVATVYDPVTPLTEQEFRRGFGRVLQILLQTLLPLALVMLVAFVIALPFNATQAFTNRDTLIAFNILLFACVGLLIGVIPLTVEELSPTYQRWLRRGLIAIASLVLLISLYALAAILYRTFQGSLTLNRLTVIGWNAINITLLALLLWRQLRPGQRTWVVAAQSIFPLGATLYIAWSGFLLLVTPWLFG